MQFFRGQSQKSNEPVVPLEEISLDGPTQTQQQAPASSEVKKKEKGVFDFSSGYPRSQMTLRIFCTGAMVAMILTAIYGFSGTKPCTPEFFYLLDAWLIVLGIVAILVEWRQRHARRLFHFLTFRTGRGGFYLFAGSLTTGISGYAGLLVGLAVVLAGFFTLFMTFFLYQKKKEIQQACR